MKKNSINHLQSWRRLLLWPLAFAMRLWGATLRIRIDEPTRALLAGGSGPTILIFWHNRLFFAAEGNRRFRKGRPIYALVSRSRDGAWLAAFFHLAGIEAIRGSSSKGGREALHSLEDRLEQGFDIAITPDGPRGPVYSVKPGPAILARRTKERVLLAGIRMHSAWRLNSWDQFMLPKPFSRVDLRCETVDPSEMPADFTACAAYLRERLQRISEQPYPPIN